MTAHWRINESESELRQVVQLFEKLGGAARLSDVVEHTHKSPRQALTLLETAAGRGLVRSPAWSTHICDRSGEGCRLPTEDGSEILCSGCHQQVGHCFVFGVITGYYWICVCGKDRVITRRHLLGEPVLEKHVDSELDAEGTTPQELRPSERFLPPALPGFMDPQEVRPDARERVEEYLSDMLHELATERYRPYLGQLIDGWVGFEELIARAQADLKSASITESSDVMAAYLGWLHNEIGSDVEIILERVHDTLRTAVEMVEGSR